MIKFISILAIFSIFGHSLCVPCASSNSLEKEVWYEVSRSFSDSDSHLCSVSAKMQSYLGSGSYDDIIGIEPPTTISEYDTFLEAYFTNLIHNIGNNMKGSCGYVAIAMLLSYYDTYLNDDIIPERYDVPSQALHDENNGKNMNARGNSPGIRYEDNVIFETGDEDDYVFIDEKKQLTAKAYYTIISDLTDKFFHSYLITVGQKLGYYDFNDDNSPCSTTFDWQKILLINYLTNDLNYKNGTDFDIFAYSGISQSSYINYIKKHIDDGLPVMVGVSGPYGNHEVIAYAYDDEYIYSNYGYGAMCVSCNEFGSRHVLLNNIDYNKIINVMAVKFKRFKSLHVHTNNYELVEDGIASYYCYCNCDIITYKEHEHNYGTYSYSNDKYHRKYCSNCFGYIDGRHQAKAGSEYNSGMHTYVVCEICNGTVCIDNEPIIGVMKNNIEIMLEDIADAEQKGEAGL